MGELTSMLSMALSDEGLSERPPRPATQAVP